MKNHGKGRSINITSEFATHVNRWKTELSATPTKVPNTFEPLKSWPAVPHPRQAELDQFRQTPSRPVD